MNHLRVVKVGGSLLEWPGLRPALDSWLASDPTPAVLICGGGRRVEAVRCSWRVRKLTQQAAHWLCIEAMETTARLLAENISAVLTDARQESELRQQARRHGRVVVDVAPFLRNVEPIMAGPALPQNWSVTSDSIAARLAQWLQAEQLVLLKSADPPQGDWQSWADAEYVDTWFPRAAADYGGAVRAVNLRSRAFDQRP